MDFPRNRGHQVGRIRPQDVLLVDLQMVFPLGFEGFRWCPQPTGPRFGACGVHGRSAPGRMAVYTDRGHLSRLSSQAELEGDLDAECVRHTHSCERANAVFLIRRTEVVLPQSLAQVCEFIIVFSSQTSWPIFRKIAVRSFWDIAQVASKNRSNLQLPAYHVGPSLIPSSRMKERL
jgi:hypothetical protein